jgi:integrase
VKDIDFSRGEITVHDGKGGKDRVTMLPTSLVTPLQEHLRLIKIIHDGDLAEGWGRVVLPAALDRKYPNAPADCRWQCVFPQANRWTNRSSGEEGRHHIQRAMKDAVTRAASSAWAAEFLVRRLAAEVPHVGPHGATE